MAIDGLKKLKEEQQENIKLLTGQEQKIKDEIKRVHTIVVDCLNKVQESSFSELRFIRETEENKNSADNKVLNKCENDIREYQNNP